MKHISIFAISLILAGCTSVGRLDSSYTAPTNRESVFVIGLTPNNYRISLFPGRVDGGFFKQNSLRNAAFYGSAENGYVVGRASAGDTLAITNVRIVENASAILGADFKPCNEAKTVVFTVPQGKVIYIGDFEYQFQSSGLSIRQSNDIEAARQNLKAVLPNLSGSLEQGEYSLLPTNSSCTGVIPVYISR